MIDPTCPDYASLPVSSSRSCFIYAPAAPTQAPCVTIVTPFYNTGPVFLETARSVLLQSLQQWEWLIVNDGSTDAETLGLLEPYRNGDPRIRVIDHPRNCGLSAARNTGFAAARTPYVIQLDSDDLLELTAAEKWAWFLESYPEFAFGKGYSVHFGALQRLWCNGFHDGSAFLEDNLVSPTSIVRTSVHHAVGGYDAANRGGLEDWDFWLRCANAGYWGGTVPEYLDWYRWRPHHANRWTNWDSGVRQRAFHAGFRQRYPRLWGGGFPLIALRAEEQLTSGQETLPWENMLKKEKPRLLLLVDEMRENSDHLLKIVQQALAAKWELSVVSIWAESLSALSQYARYTPDVFTLSHFLRERDYPRFLSYFLSSRQIEAVVNAHSVFASLLLPELRSRFPHVTYVSLWDAPQVVPYAPLSLADEMSLKFSDAHLLANQETGAWLAAHGLENACSYLYQEEFNFPECLQQIRDRSVVGQSPMLSGQTVSALSAAFAVAMTKNEGHVRRASALHRELEPQLLDARSASWRTFAYFAIRKLTLPYYRTVPERWKRLLLPLVGRVKQLLTREC